LHLGQKNGIVKENEEGNNVMVRTNQGGSVLSFIVVGVVLVALFVGGAYTVHRLITQPEQPAPVQPDDRPPQPDKAKDNPSKDQPQKSEDKSNKSSQNRSANNNTAQQKPSTELPQTGPAELFGSLLALGLLTGSAVSYARSRRLAPSL
jgi:cytoskeletal protein RodZ